jgi:dipeptidase D
MLTGLRGGHSGIDIHQGRGNAIKLLALMLWQAGRNHVFHLAHLEGGSKRNAIAREARAQVIVPKNAVEDFQAALQSRFEDRKAEFKAVETDMVLNVEPVDDEVFRVCDRASQEKVLNIVFALPHGVLAMSQEIPDLVETSNNVATVEWGADRVKIGLSSRSSIGSALEATRNMLKAIADMAGAEIEQPPGYPSWTPNMDSPILNIMKGIYKDLFKKEADIKAIHAGLECGLIGEKFAGMDMISFGPDLEHPHSPDERVRIESVQNFWRLLEIALEQLAMR